MGTFDCQVIVHHLGTIIICLFVENIMEFSSLCDMIRYIQYGTNFHIGVVFLGDNGNDKCHLPHEHEIHSSAMCQMFKKILHCALTFLRRTS